MSEIEFRTPQPEELAPLFPNYRILSLIATGGMGAVYHAVQTSLEREVAIKILPGESGNDPEFSKSFAAEAKTMARLNHPNLITVYDFGEVNGTFFIVMEHVPGQSLHAAYGGSAVDPAEVIRLMTGISMGLAHAHGNGILHRDIKPGNILLDSRQQPKIGDFGLARPMDAQVGEGETIFGTPGYTAPEVLEPPHRMDQKTDIFALGVLLHELLTGKLPASDPRPPSAISRCDTRFDAVVRKATHPDPRQRYQSAAEMTDALRKIASTAGPGVSHSISPAVPRPPVSYRPRAGHRVSARPSKNGAGGLLAAVFLIGGLLAAYFLRHQILGTEEPGPRPTPLVEQGPEPGPVTTAPEPLVSVPGPEASQPQPLVAEPQPVVLDPESLVTGPGPVVLDPGPQPKFDVEGFLKRARSVMVGRCAPQILKCEQSLEKNLADFRSEGLKLIKRNLDKVYHQGGERELDAYIDTCRRNGGRLAEQLERPLKFKKWLVELHEAYQEKQGGIEEALAGALAEHKKTYLYGLSLKVKALHEADDPAAIDLIKAEIDSATADPDYFPGLMLTANEG